MPSAIVSRLVEELIEDEVSGVVEALPRVSVLLVDDRLENLVALESSLEPLGQRLVRAMSGEAALRAVLDEQFAVILMDIRMPGLDGFETLALLRQREKSKHIPIIFLTAFSEQETQIRSYASGAVDVLQKPFDPATLRAKVRVFVHLRQNALALQAVRDELEDRVAARTRDLEHEIEQRKAIEQRLIEQAHRDALTGLANRKLLLEHLRHALSRWRREPHQKGSYFAVMMLDLDRFKSVNDTLGHLAGDQLLVEVAQRLEGCLRGGDTAARLGGDEFAVLLEGIDSARDATRAAERIQRALTPAYTLEGRQVTVSASIGIAVADERYERADELLRDADAALYRSKDAGRARTRMFDKAMHEVMLAQLRDESELSVAVARNELRLHYQPIVSIATGDITGFEALVRWQHPTRGLVVPNRFIPLAEETGLIRPIGRWVIDHACAQLAAWQRPNLRLGVNVSAKQLAEPGLAAHVAQALHTHSIDPGLVDIELTESTMMKGTVAEATELAELRTLGVTVSLDDFGTGYSCLATLQQLSVSALKIDRSFITPLGTDEARPAIVKAIVTLAHALDLRVIAEGVETESQLSALRTLSCEHAQGFYFSPPVPADAATYLLNRHRN
jgi:diguanylate cyclase (GGDEF)-like protein